MFNKLFTLLKKKRLIRQKISELESQHQIKLNNNEKNFIRYYYNSESQYRVGSIGNFVLHKWDEEHEGEWQRLVFLKDWRFMMKFALINDLTDIEQWKKQPPQELIAFAEKLFANFEDVLSSAAKAFCNESYQLGREVEFSSLEDFRVTEIMIAEEGKEDIRGIIWFYIRKKTDQSWFLRFGKDLVFHELSCFERNDSDT